MATRVANPPVPAPSASVDSAPAVGAPDRLIEYAETTGLPFFLVDRDTCRTTGVEGSEILPFVPDDVARALPRATSAAVWEAVPGVLHYALPLDDFGEAQIAVGYVFSETDVRPDDVVVAAADRNWSADRLERYLAEHPRCSRPLLERLVSLAWQQSWQRSTESQLLSEIDELTAQIGQTYEEISLLHELARNLQISRSPREVAELCLTRTHELIGTSGTSIWLQDRSGRPHYLVEGEMPFDESGLTRLISRFEDHAFSRPLVKNAIPGTLLGADFPGLRNFVMVPIAEGRFRSGWITSCNTEDSRELGTVEACLLNSIATILGTHVRNIGLYEEHQELLIAFVQSLVHTLDAKDPYTRGHSERVALVARRLGEELCLPESDLYDLYLSGILHDIGKIGVDDRILRKPGKLTDEEFEQIQQHPMIGFNILQGLKNLQPTLPGVRNHHEAWDGSGYPDGLRGEEIPLVARILAVADGYDAMGSDRPYRDGMPLEKVDAILRDGAGKQWDPRVVDAYFRIRDDVRRMWEDYKLFSGSYLRHRA